MSAIISVKPILIAIVLMKPPLLMNKQPYQNFVEELHLGTTKHI